MKRIALIALALAAGSTAASAHDGYGYGSRYNVDARQARQAHRIDHARRTGELTWFESMRLKAEQRRIAGMERRALRDGHIDRYEQFRLRDAQNRASRHIYSEAHDGQTSWWRRRWY